MVQRSFGRFSQLQYDSRLDAVGTAQRFYRREKEVDDRSSIEEAADNVRGGVVNSVVIRNVYVSLVVNAI